MSFARMQICGNLGSDPELRFTPEGKAVCDFSIAVNSKVKGVESTMWVRVTLWGKQAENAHKYLCKGAEVYCEGTPQLSKWTDRAGNDQTSLELNFANVQFLNSKLGRSESEEGMPTGADKFRDAPPSEFDGELGF